MDDRRWCKLLRELKLRDPVRYHAVIEEIRAVLDAPGSHSSRIHTIDSSHTRIVMLRAMPPAVTDSRSETSTHEDTRAYLEEVERQCSRERDAEILRKAAAILKRRGK